MQCLTLKPNGSYDLRHCAQQPLTNWITMLTQLQADALIAMHKLFVDQQAIAMPAGTDQTRELIGADPHERFLLDMWRGTLRLSKVRHQTRARKVVVLVRLDIDGAPHTTPDGQKLGGTHLHIYREGYDAKWAYELDPIKFASPSNLRRAFEDFCAYCHITNVPPFQEVLL